MSLFLNFISIKKIEYKKYKEFQFQTFIWSICTNSPHNFVLSSIAIFQFDISLFGMGRI